MAHPWLCITACALVLKGEIGKARQDAAAAIDAALLPGENWRTIWALEADAMAAFWAGDAERALTSATQMAAGSQQSTDRFLTPAARIQLGGALYLSGDPAAAVNELEAFDAESGWDRLTSTPVTDGNCSPGPGSPSASSMRPRRCPPAPRSAPRPPTCHCSEPRHAWPVERSGSPAATARRPWSLLATQQ